MDRFPKPRPTAPFADSSLPTTACREIRGPKTRPFFHRAWHNAKGAQPGIQQRVSRFAAAPKTSIASQVDMLLFLSHTTSIDFTVPSALLWPWQESPRTCPSYSLPCTSSVIQNPSLHSCPSPTFVEFGASRGKFALNSSSIINHCSGNEMNRLNSERRTDQETPEKCRWGPNAGNINPTGSKK